MDQSAKRQPDMNNLLPKLKVWLDWALLQTYPLWLVLAAPILALPVTYFTGEQGVKLYALAVQLGGGWIATSVIRQNLEMFKAGGVKAAIVGWWNRRPRRRNITISLEAGNMAMTGHAARLRVNVGRGPDDSMEVQVDKLWNSVKQLWDETDTNRQELEFHLGELRTSLADVKATHEKTTSELAEVVKKVAASSPLWAYFGAWLAAVGTVLSTYTHELSCWLHG